MNELRISNKENPEKELQNLCISLMDLLILAANCSKY